MNILLLVFIAATVALYFKRNKSPRFKAALKLVGVLTLILMLVSLGLWIAFRDINN